MVAEPDLLDLSAPQATAMSRRRKLSPVEPIAAILAQIERIAPLNALITVLHDRARTAARAAEQAVMGGEALAPLHGVLVHVKDQVDSAGIRTTFGSAIFADNVPCREDLHGEDLSGIRIGWYCKAANPQLDLDMPANARAWLATLAAMGAHVAEVTEPVDWIEFPARIPHQGNFHVAMQKHLPHRRDQMDATLLAFVERGGKFNMVNFRKAQHARTNLFQEIQALFTRYDVSITPTATALAAEFDAANDEVLVNGKCGIARLGWMAYVSSFNLTGHPALTVPCGFPADGLPTSVQIVGRWGADMDVSRLGALLEQAPPRSGKCPPRTD